MYKLSFNIEPDIRDSLVEEANAQDRPVGWVIRKALEQYLNKPEKKHHKVKEKKESIFIPDFIDGELWIAFMEVRKKLKAPATEQAHKLLISKLEAIYNKGLDPNQALQASIENGWKGVFEPKTDKKFPPQRTVDLGAW